MSPQFGKRAAKPLTPAAVRNAARRLRLYADELEIVGGNDHAPLNNPRRLANSLRSLQALVRTIHIRFFLSGDFKK